MAIHESGEDYLEAILMIQKETVMSALSTLRMNCLFQNRVSVLQ
jgi:hypothetical protein